MTEREMDLLSERQEMEALLAWRHTGKLSPQELQRVERYLQQHPELEQQSALTAEEASATRAGAEAFGAPSAASLDRLMARVDRSPRQRSRAMWTSAGQALEAVAGWLAGLPRVQLGAIAAAAVVLIAVQAAGLVTLLGSDNRVRTYETASSPASAGASSGTFALIAFQPTATAADIVALLETAGADIVEGPKAGVWRVRIARGVLDQPQAEALLARLREKTAVVGFAALAR